MDKGSPTEKIPNRVFIAIITKNIPDFWYPAFLFCKVFCSSTLFFWVLIVGNNLATNPVINAIKNELNKFYPDIIRNCEKALSNKNFDLDFLRINKNDFSSYVDNVVNDLSNLPPNAMKKGLNAYNNQEFDDFEKSMEFLEKEIGESIQSEEAKEGITAFLEKRKPNWT